MKTVFDELFKRWPIIVVAASAAVTVVWIGALIWVLLVLITGFSEM